MTQVLHCESQRQMVIITLLFIKLFMLFGASYTISGKFKDLIGGVTELWAEMVLEQPQQGVDVLGTVLKAPNVNLSTAQEFETYFRFLLIWTTR